MGVVFTPLICSECKAELTYVYYTMWGTRRFNPETGKYEDEGLATADIEFTCPPCGARLDGEEISL